MRRALALLALAATLGAAAQEAPDLAPAMRAADAWIALVDAGRYGESWDAAAPLFQETIPRTRWEVSVQAAREKLGAVAARKLRSATYATTLPGAPPGEYVVIEFTTHFDKRPLTVETVTPRREADGRWKVSGYLVR